MAKRKQFVYEDFLKEWYEFNPNMKLSYTEKPRNVRDKIYCHCDICGCDYDSTVWNLRTAMKRNSKYKGCRVCSNQVIVEGVNDSLTKAPHIEKYIVDKEQAKHIGLCPNKSRKILAKCDICGYETEKNIYDLARYGMCCPKCSDTISIPNKIIHIFMEQFRKEVKNLTFEYCSDWTCGKRYDVYFEKNRKKYAIEMDGEQHFRDAFYIAKEHHEHNDAFKDFIALGNNVTVIRIDCSTGKFNDIADNIRNSLLNDLFTIKNTTIEKCKEAYNSNIFLSVLEDRKNGLSLKQLSDKHHLGKTTVLRYLHKGEDLGLLKAFEYVDRENIFYAVLEDRKLGLTLSELMEKHHICKDTVLRYLHKGEDMGLLKAFKDGGLVRKKAV